MKKILVVLLAVAFCSAAPIQSEAAGTADRGGVVGFLVGCCFGIRNGVAWNEGKDLHFRDWGVIIPVVGWVIAVWNGIDTAGGITSKELASMYGSHFY
jgi:hypothetical protein